jgi:hypothetical protein
LANKNSHQSLAQQDFEAKSCVNKKKTSKPCSVKVQARKTELIVGKIAKAMLTLVH